MRGAVLYGPRDVRFDERAGPEHHRADRRRHPAIRDVHLRLGSVALSRSRTRPATRPPWVTSTAASSKRSAAPSRRSSRASSSSDRFRLRQHLPPLSGRLPDIVRTSAMGRRCAGAAPPRAAGGRHAGRDARTSRPRPGSRACSPRPTCWAPGGSRPTRPTCKPGATVAVVGDGAVGLLGVLSAKQMGAERIIAMSRHEPRQKLAREFGATDIVTERGDEGVARVKELTRGVGADSVLECVGTQESMAAGHPRDPSRAATSVTSASRTASSLDGAELFFYARSSARRTGAGAPLPSRAHRAGLNGTSIPARSSTSTLPLDQVAEGYRAMDERRAIKTLLRP